MVNMVMMIVIMVVVVVMMGPTQCYAAQEMSPLPKDVKDCELTLDNAVEGFCLANCGVAPQCNLYCEKADGECEYYTAKMTTNWQGMGPASDRTCSSKLVSSMDQAKSITTTSSSSVYGSGWESGNAINGYYCKDTKDYCFSSEEESKPWWRADLGESKSIITMDFFIHNDTDEAASYFKDIKVTFGDSDDYDNPTFKNYTGPAELGDTVKLISLLPVSGRYLQVSSTADTRLVFCGIRVLGL